MLYTFGSMQDAKGAEPTLEEVYKLAKENNKMLRAMRRDAFVGGIFKFIFWILMFFILPYIIYAIYLKPYLSSLESAYNNFNESASTLSGAAKDLENLQNQIPNFGDLLKNFQGGQ